MDPLNGDKISQLQPSQLDFLAEDTMVTIRPNFKLPSLHLIGTQAPLPAFRPGLPVSVPLWLALHLRKNERCRVQPPDWLDAKYLAGVQRDEMQKDEWSDLPYHYMEIAQLLMTVCPQDLPRVSRIRTLLEDIWNHRNTKLRDGLLKLDDSNVALKLNNLGAMEVNVIRDYLGLTLDQFLSFKEVKERMASTAVYPASSSATASGLRAGIRQSASGTPRGRAGHAAASTVSSTADGDTPAYSSATAPSPAAAAAAAGPLLLRGIKKKRKFSASHSSQEASGSP